MRLSTFHRWLCTVALGLAASLYGQTPNLLLNGGLETPDPAHPERPVHFEPGAFGRYEAETTWESPGYRGGRCIAVRTPGPSSVGYWRTVVPVRPDTTYTIRFHYQTQTGAPPTEGDPFYASGRPGGANLELGAVPDESTVPGKPTAWSDTGIALPPVGGLFLPLASEWSLFQHTFVTRPRQKELVVKFRLWCYAAKARFDDISITEGAAPHPPRTPDALWTALDTTPPAVFRPGPPPAGSAGPRSQISAEFADIGSGVNVASVRILLDGKDRTGDATVRPDGFVLTPSEPLAPGPHRASVTLADQAGNAGNVLTWQFGVGATVKNVLTADAAGMRLNGEPFFPIGIYAYACHPDDGRFREDHLAQAAAAGYNIVLNTIEREQGLDKELAHGVMGTLNITYSLRDCTDPAAARIAVLEEGQGRLASHPSVVAFWGDDPENVENTESTPLSPTAAEKLRNASAVLKEHWPGIPWICAISNLPRLQEGMRYGDILLSYRYAVPQYHPIMINGWTIAVCRKSVPDKPLWFLSQAIDLGYGANVGVPEFRPTPQEIRAMAFYSLVCGVQGYCIYANYLNHEDFPEHWATALGIATHLRQLAPVLASGTSGAEAKLVSEPHSGSIFLRELAYEGRHTLIAVNMSAGPVPATWEFARPTRVVALFEDRAMARAAATVRDLFEPWEAHVYQWE